MKKAIEVYGKRLFATQHATQDRLFVHKFEHNGQTIHIGALADGCTGDNYDLDYRPGLGAEWMVKEFARQAHILYQQRLRGNGLGRAIALAILAGMRDYQPRYSRSKWLKGPCGKYCDELIATIYGFVADNENLLVVTCGDGYLIHDGQCHTVEQSGVYPTDMLTLFPEDEWPDKLETYFIIQSVDIGQINTFGIASDGLFDLGLEEVKAVLAQKGQNPRTCLNELFHLPLKKKHDDITIVYMAVR